MDLRVILDVHNAKDTHGREIHCVVLLVNCPHVDVELVRIVQCYKKIRRKNIDVLSQEKFCTIIDS